MDEDIEAIFNASILMEEKCSKFYFLLSALFKEDTFFWEGLAVEEENHATLMSSVKLLFFENPRYFPVEALAKNLQDVLDTNNKIDALMIQYAHTPPDREAAFRAAIDIENSSGEYSFQLAASGPENTPAFKIFKKLVAADKDHAKRIEARMNSFKRTS